MAVAATAAVLAGALAAQGGQPELVSTATLAPNPITSSLDALYTTTYQNTGGTTLTNAAILVTLPAGADFKAAQPTGCTEGDTAQDGTTVVTCPRGLMPPDAEFEQQIVFSAPPVTAADDITITSRLRFNERDNDGDLGPQHDDTTFAPDATALVHPASRDLHGECISNAGGNRSTQGSATTKKNPQITSAVVPANPDLACIPILVRELPVGTPGACPPEVTCRTEISVTDAPLFEGTPIQLSFAIDGSLFGKAPNIETFKWYKNGVLVLDCDDPESPNSDPCVETREPNGVKGIKLGVRWSGNDPSWGG